MFRIQQLIKIWNLIRKQPGGRKLPAYQVYIIYTFTTALFFTMVFTVNLVYQSEVIQLDPLQLVLVGTALEAACFLFELPTGIVADLYSRKKSVLIGLVLIGTGFITEGSASVFITVLVAQVMWGMGSTFISGAIDAWIAEEETVKSLEKIYLKGSQAGEVGAAAGILIGTVIGNFSLRIPIITGGSLFIVLAVFLLFFMPEYNFKPSVMQRMTIRENIGHTLQSGFAAIKINKAVRIFLLITFFTGLSGEGFDRLYTVHFLKDTILPKVGELQPVTWFGIFSLAGTVLNLTILYIIEKGMAKNKINQLLFLIYNNSFCIISVILFALTRNFYIMVLTYLLTSCLKTVNNPIFNARLNSSIEDNVRATVLSANGQMNALGQILGGPIIGIIAERLSVSTGIFYTGILLIPVVLLYGFSVNTLKSADKTVNKLLMDNQSDAPG